MSQRPYRQVIGRHPVRKMVLRKAERMVTGPVSIRAAASVIVTATAFVVVIGAVAMRVLDPKEFPSIWLSLWWSVQTATTVGYGDVAPHKVAGRIVGTVVMLQGIAFLAVTTASITSVFVARAQRQLRAGDEGWQEVLTRLDALDRRLDSLVPPGGSPSSNDVPVPARVDPRGHDPAEEENQ
jgi:voltage-gated potassium channel